MQKQFPGTDQGGQGIINKDGEKAVPEGFETENAFRMAEIAPGYEQIPVYRNCNPIRLTGRHIWLLYHITDKQSPYYMTRTMPVGMQYPWEESEEMSLLRADFLTCFDAEGTRMISGEVFIDAEWDTYVQNMKACDVDRSIETVPGTYDRFANLF